MSSNALYTDLSGYYDLMCADIDYQEQSHYVRRLHQLFGNGGNCYLDMACGTGPHLRYFLEFGFLSHGIDINQPMLDIAKIRCPDAHFSQQDMSNLRFTDEIDLISCFLYSIHYNQTLEKLRECITSVHRALKTGGIFCFNSVDKNTIDNREGIKRLLTQDESEFSFQSNWYYSGEGDKQELQLTIEKSTDGLLETWRDQHSMVALTFVQLKELLDPLFEVHIFAHDYQKIIPWDNLLGNANFVCVKR
jgi:ubiquinone/menaquinone biosynthesis C-methylase UbiE